MQLLNSRSLSASLNSFLWSMIVLHIWSNDSVSRLQIDMRVGSVSWKLDTRYGARQTGTPNSMQRDVECCNPKFFAFALSFNSVEGDLLLLLQSCILFLIWFGDCFFLIVQFFSSLDIFFRRTRGKNFQAKFEAAQASSKGAECSHFFFSKMSDFILLLTDTIVTLSFLMNTNSKVGGRFCS